MTPEEAKQLQKFDQIAARIDDIMSRQEHDVNLLMQIRDVLMDNEQMLLDIPSEQFASIGFVAKALSMSQMPKFISMAPHDAITAAIIQGFQIGHDYAIRHGNLRP